MENTKLNRLQQARQTVVNDYKQNRALFIGGILLTMLLAVGLTSWLWQYLLVLTGRLDAISIPALLTAWLWSPTTIVLTLLMLVILLRGLYRIRRLYDSNYIMHEDENYKEAKTHVYGDAHFLRGDEKKEVFVMSKDFDKIHGDILGIDDHGLLYALRDDLLSFNRNRIIFGASRSGKSSAFILNDLIQIFRRGESVIVTDTKGDLFRDTAHIAKEFDYTIRMLDIKPDELKNSDAWEPLKYITIEDEIQAEVLARAIIENTLSGPMDYWATNEMNALKATLLLVATTETYESCRSMGEVVNIFANPAAFDTKFVGLTNDNPAKIAYNNFAMCNDVVKGQILNGMSIRLSLLQNKYVKNIISHDEIDLILPMKEKCIYYIVIPDTESTTKFLASMFFTQCFTAQVRYADSLNREQKKSLIPVRYELDEAKSIGKIPDFDKKISTFASRKITSTLAFQNKGQLESLYPKVVGVDGSFEDIFANSATQILVKGGDTNTCEYFSEIMGQTTAIIENAAHEKARTKIKDLHDQERVSEGLGQRPLRYPYQLLRMPANEVYIEIIGFGPIKLNKYICEKNNPIYLKHYQEEEPNKHIPEWRKEIIRKTEEAKAMVNKSADGTPATPVAPAVGTNSSSSKSAKPAAKKSVSTDKKKPSTSSGDSKPKPKTPAVGTNGKPAVPAPNGSKPKIKKQTSTTPATAPTTENVSGKSAYEAARDNSWECPKCGEMNFDTDLTCINCHTKKPKKRKNPIAEALGE